MMAADRTNGWIHLDLDALASSAVVLRPLCWKPKKAASPAEGLAALTRDFIRAAFAISDDELALGVRPCLAERTSSSLLHWIE